MNKILNYLATHLFGSKAAAMLAGGLSGAVHVIMAANPGITLDSVTALVNTQLTPLISKALTLAKIPAWAVPFVTPILISGADDLVAKLYAQVTAEKKP